MPPDPAPWAHREFPEGHYPASVRRPALRWGLERGRALARRGLAPGAIVAEGMRAFATDCGPALDRRGREDPYLEETLYAQHRRGLVRAAQVRHPGWDPDDAR